MSRKKADHPLCLRCGEDDPSMVEKREHKTYTDWFCNVCGMGWRVSKTSEE